MRAAEFTGVDLIQELRLRHWAREHYVPAEQRHRQWHPIVLEEMSFRDAELEPLRMVHEMLCASFVPLAPTETYFIDPPHDAVPSPKSLHAPSAAMHQLH